MLWMRAACRGTGCISTMAGATDDRGGAAFPVRCRVAAATKRRKSCCAATMAVQVGADIGAAGHFLDNCPAIGGHPLRMNAAIGVAAECSGGNGSVIGVKADLEFSGAIARHDPVIVVMAGIAALADIRIKYMGIMGAGSAELQCALGRCC